MKIVLTLITSGDGGAYDYPEGNIGWIGGQISATDIALAFKADHSQCSDHVLFTLIFRLHHSS